MGKSTKKEKFDYKTIRTFEDACKHLGIKPDLSDLESVPEEYRKPLIANYKLQVIYKAINNGWKPDWSNFDQYKYYPWFGMLSSGFGFYGSNSSSTYTITTVGSRLCTNSSEKALYIAKQFEQEYKDYFCYSE